MFLLRDGKEECSGSVFISLALSQLSDLEHFESAFVVLLAINSCVSLL